MRRLSLRNTLLAAFPYIFYRYQSTNERRLLVKVSTRFNVGIPYLSLTTDYNGAKVPEFKSCLLIVGINGGSNNLAFRYEQHSRTLVSSKRGVVYSHHAHSFRSPRIPYLSLTTDYNGAKVPEFKSCLLIVGINGGSNNLAFRYEQHSRTLVSSKRGVVYSHHAHSFRSPQRMWEWDNNQVHGYNSPFSSSKIHMSAIRSMWSKRNDLLNRMYDQPS